MQIPCKMLTYCTWGHLIFNIFLNISVYVINKLSNWIVQSKGTVAHKCHNTIQIRKYISISTTHFQTRNTTQWLPKTHFNVHNTFPNWQHNSIFTENTFQYPQHISKLTTQLVRWWKHISICTTNAFPNLETTVNNYIFETKFKIRLQTIIHLGSPLLLGKILVAHAQESNILKSAIIACATVLLPLFCHLLFTWAFNLIILTCFALCVEIPRVLLGTKVAWVRGW